MPKATCLTCHRLIPVGQSYCSAHARKPRRSPKVSPRKRGLDYTYDKNRKITLSIYRGCILCGKPGANSADHVIPRKHGGNNELWNLAPSHVSCNSSRQAKALTPEQTQRLHEYRGMLGVYLSANPLT